jgi:hypothetical protein
MDENAPVCAERSKPCLRHGKVYSPNEQLFGSFPVKKMHFQVADFATEKSCSLRGIEA